MKCTKCGNTNMLEEHCDEDELVCGACGATYGLEYLGYYPEGENERVDEGYEPPEWKRQCATERKQHERKKKVTR